MTKPYLWALSMLALCAPASAETFTFDDIASFTPVPFSLTSGTLTANFFSPQGPGAFFTVPTVFATLTGNVLIESDPNRSELRILFDDPIQTLSLLFALNTGQASDALSLSAFSQGTLVGSISATGAVPGGSFGFPEGSISFSGAIFDEVRLTSDAIDFAIDDLNVTLADSAVPEPSSLWLGGAGVAFLAIVQRRRHTVS